MTTKTMLTALTAAAAALSISASALAVPLTITVTNNQAPGGLAFTPVYFGFGGGEFDAFDVGSEASSGVELVAEVGVFSDPGDTVAELTLAETRVFIDPESRGGVAAAPQGNAPVFEAGESVTITLDVDPETQRFAQFISMLLPSNDTFFGNDDPLALFDEFGVFNGPQTIDILASNLYDAGTEANDLGNGPAFVQGQIGGAGETTFGVISGGVTLDSLGITGDITLATGDILELVLAEQFFAQNGSLATITIDLAQSEVPVPAAAFLFAPLAAGFVAMRKRRHAA